MEATRCDQSNFDIFGARASEQSVLSFSCVVRCDNLDVDYMAVEDCCAVTEDYCVPVNVFKYTW